METSTFFLMAATVSCVFGITARIAMKRETLISESFFVSFISLYAIHCAVDLSKATSNAEIALNVVGILLMAILGYKQLLVTRSKAK